MEREEHRVVVGHDLHPQPGYPFALALRIEYALSDDGLRVSTTATNVGVDPCPYGAGAHPYLSPGSPTVDTAILRVPARSVLEVERQVDGPSTGRSSTSGRQDPSARRSSTTASPISSGTTTVSRGSRSRAARQRGLTLWADEAYPYLMLYTGDDRPDVRRRSLAVEPMTCPPQAFRSGEAVIVLEPGDSVTATWGLSFS